MIRDWITTEKIISTGYCLFIYFFTIQTLPNNHLEWYHI